MENLFIARQAIYNAQQNVTGYELLYRNGEVEKAVFEDGELASCETIINTFMHIGIDRLTGSALAFINIPRAFIINESLTPMFREQTVLEILEDIEPSEDIVIGLKRLKSSNFKIALDDFEYHDKYIPLLELADYVKIDVLKHDEPYIIQTLEKIARYNVRLVAEKVETQQKLTFCQQAGFDYFQGFYFCKPQLVKEKHIPASKTVALNLLNRLQNPEVDFEELEAILAQDVVLSYKLLRYINSAAFSLRREIDSIRDAITLLGINNTRNWASMILMVKAGEYKPAELISVALIRGKMCELLARKISPEIQGQMFITGLFSVLDALMDMEMIDLLDTIILSGPIKMALLDHSGEHGRILEYVLQYERFEWGKLIQADVRAEVLIETYIEAISWSKTQIDALTQL